MVRASVLLVCLLAVLAFGGQAASQIINPSFEEREQVTDEPVVLTGTGAVNLSHPPVIPETVVVTNQDKTVTYVRGTDYNIGGGVRIARTSNSRIPSGATVLVSYQYATLAGWTRYGYTVPGEGGQAVLPAYGSPGGSGTFDVLYPDQGAADGQVVVGYQGWGDPKNGGVYQTFEVTSGAGVLIISARAFSLNWSFQPTDIGNRVRAGLAIGVATDRSAVTEWYGDRGAQNYWGPGWCDISIPVPGPGTYTLFIENHIAWGSGIWSSLWDNVRLELCQVNITSGPTVTATGTDFATIEWDTDQPSSTIVHWDTDGPPYANTTIGDPGTHHSVTLTGLSDCATYHFSIKSEAPPCAPATSPDLTFMTSCLPCGPTLCNGDFEATDETGNPTLAPWRKIGRFDGLIEGPWFFGLTAHSPTHFAGTAASYDKKDGAALFQTVYTEPGKRYMAQCYIWTQNVGGVPQNTSVRIGIDPLGGTDPNSPSVQWNITGDTWSYTQHWETGAQLGWQPIFVFATAERNISTVFLQVKHKFADAWNVTAFDDVSFGEAVTASSAALCKKLPAGWPVEMTNKAVTYVYPLSPPFCYIEDDDRVAGIKVKLPDDAPMPSVGDRIDIVGYTSVADNEAQVNATSITINAPSTVPDPIGIPNKSVGGGQSGIQPAVPGGVGLSTTGLLVRTFGRCVAIDWVPNPFNWLCPFWIDDGSGINGGTRYDTGQHVTGLKVYYGLATAPYNVGNYLLVTGVAGVEIHDPTPLEPHSGDEYPVRVLYVRDSSDVVDLGP